MTTTLHEVFTPTESGPFTSIADVKNEWGHTSTRAYAFMEWCLIKCEEALPSGLIHVLTTPISIQPSTSSLQSVVNFVFTISMACIVNFTSSEMYCSYGVCSYVWPVSEWRQKAELM